MHRSIAPAARNVKPWTACVATRSYVTKVTGQPRFRAQRPWVWPVSWLNYRCQQAYRAVARGVAMITRSAEIWPSAGPAQESAQSPRKRPCPGCRSGSAFSRTTAGRGTVPRTSLMSRPGPRPWPGGQDGQGDHMPRSRMPGPPTRGSAGPECPAAVSARARCNSRPPTRPGTRPVATNRPKMPPPGHRTSAKLDRARGTAAPASRHTFLGTGRAPRASCAPRHPYRANGGRRVVPRRAGRVPLRESARARSQPSGRLGLGLVPQTAKARCGPRQRCAPGLVPKAASRLT